MEVLRAIIIVLILILAVYWYRHSPYNTVYEQVGNRQYQVHKLHDTKGAAELMSEITNRNRTLIKHLESKYLGESFRGHDPDHGNRIDVVRSTDLYYTNPMERDVASGLGKVAQREEIQERITQLIKNYQESDITEISPTNPNGYTSYTEDKTKLVLCLRKKEPLPDGTYPLEDVNMMMFVVIHELTHMMNQTWGHPYEFWVLFRFMLQNAAEAGVYQPIDYGANPRKYCGMKISYNPYFDRGLK